MQACVCISVDVYSTYAHIRLVIIQLYKAEFFLPKLVFIKLYRNKLYSFKLEMRFEKNLTRPGSEEREEKSLKSRQFGFKFESIKPK